MCRRTSNIAVLIGRNELIKFDASIPRYDESINNKYTGQCILYHQKMQIKQGIKAQNLRH